DFIKRTTLPDSRLKSITSEELLSKVRSLMGKQHEVLYYGPEKEAAVAEILAGHHCREGLENLVRTRTPARSTDKPAVYIAPYDAKQLYYIQYSNRGEKFDLSADAEIELYNGYFGGGMNAIVFQEMREARGLAYTAYTTLSSPGFKDDTYYYLAFIATQNDKMKQAIEAFDDIINNMPESENAFDIAKESLISRLRTERTTGYDVLWSYLDNRDLGLEESRDRAIFEKLQDMTLEDVKAAQEKWVKGRQYIYGILGDEKDIDMSYLRTLGPVNRLTLEDIFGY
ncbi:MAG: insulinase family protein, partial [Bacteroidales bacterium]|nr:insulinase family protein [Bacteroidales bacterium]